MGRLIGVAKNLQFFFNNRYRHEQKTADFLSEISAPLKSAVSRNSRIFCPCEQIAKRSSNANVLQFHTRSASLKKRQPSILSFNI